MFILVDETVKVRYCLVAEFYGFPLEIAAKTPSTPGSTDFQETTPESTPSATAHEWSDGQTKMMLTLYKENLDNVGPLKDFKNKKKMWEFIRDQLFEQCGVSFSSKQVENRYKTVSRRRQIAKANNRTSGSTFASTPFDAEFEEIVAIDDSIEPELQMDTTSMKTKITSSKSNDSKSTPSSGSVTPSQSPSPKPTKNKGGSRSHLLQEKMLEAFAKAQEEKQERHRERMEKLDTITQLLQRIADK